MIRIVIIQETLLQSHQSFDHLSEFLTEFICQIIANPEKRNKP